MEIKIKYVIYFILISSINLIAQIPIGSVFHFAADYYAFPLGSKNKLNKWVDLTGKLSAVQDNRDFQPYYLLDGINGLPAINFDGIDDYMRAPGVFPVQSDYTIVLVFRPRRFSHHILGGERRSLWLDGQSIPKILHNGDFNRQLVSSIDPKIRPTLMIAQFRNSNQYGSFFINGNFADSSILARNNDTAIWIGGHKNGKPFAGLISEIILFPRILTNSERVILEEHLLKKYDLAPDQYSNSWFSKIPSEGQLFPRNNNNQAKVNFNGRIPQSEGWDSIYLDYSPTPVIKFNLGTKLVYKKGFADFHFVVNINSDLFNKIFWIRVTKPGKDSLILRRANILCGDIFLVNGQSNAIWGSLPDTDPFIRTYGVNNSKNKQDSFWNYASCYTNGGGPQIGVWAYQIANKIVEEQKIPVCIINGAVPGSTIESHLRDENNPEDTNNLYGDLLYRTKKANLDSFVKGIFWYQGESDYAEKYQEKFNQLYSNWIEDYPNLKKIYVIQSHHGCGTEENPYVREIQRNINRNLPKVDVMSTNSIPGHDGCYFSPLGYSELANRLYPLVKRDFYNGSYNPNMDAPNIDRVYYLDGKKDKINIIVKPSGQNLILPKDTLIANDLFTIKDYFGLNGNYNQCSSVTIKGDTIKLLLKSSSSATKLNYLTDKNYLNSNLVFQGPYITNSNGIGMMSSYGVNIENSGTTSTAEIGLPRFHVFPNPAFENKLIITTEVKDIIEISVTNVMGEKIKNIKESILNNYVLHLPEIIPGLYFIECKNNKSKYLVKWIKY